MTDSCFKRANWKSTACSISLWFVDAYGSLRYERCETEGAIRQINVLNDVAANEKGGTVYLLMKLISRIPLSRIEHVNRYTDG